jgi:hypothetical protein
MSQTGILTAAAVAAALTASAAFAQQQQQQRLNGTIERVDGNTIYAKGRDGGAITLKLADNATVTAVLRATVADIKPGAYIGSGAMPQPDGSQKAVEVHIFAKPQADNGHHYAGWYGAPNGTMTNGFVEPSGMVGAALSGGGEPSFMVKYHDGEKRIIVPANAHIVRYGRQQGRPQGGRGLQGPDGNQAGRRRLHDGEHQRRPGRWTAVLNRFRAYSLSG